MIRKRYTPTQKAALVLEVLKEEATLPTDITFTGHRSESGLGSLMDFRARFYSPLTGRFISADTIVPEAGNPQAFNRYAYVFNNPLKYTDPSGHDPCGGPGVHVPDCGVDGWYGEHPVMLNPSDFGYIPGVNVDSLPYMFYLDPRQFDFVASVEYANDIARNIAPMVCGTVHQGCIPDQPGTGENYPVISDMYYGTKGERLWYRDVMTPDGREPAFTSYWGTGEFNGERVAVETFLLTLGENTIIQGTAYLRAVVGDPSLPTGSKDPIRWETVAYSAAGSQPLATDQMKVIFETRQTGATTIQTVGSIYFLGQLQGTIILNGTYKGP